MSNLARESTQSKWSMQLPCILFLIMWKCAAWTHHPKCAQDCVCKPCTSIDNPEKRTIIMKRTNPQCYFLYKHFAITPAPSKPSAFCCYRRVWSLLTTIYMTLLICFTKNFYSLFRMFYATHTVCYWLWPVTVKRYKKRKSALLTYVVDEPSSNECFFVSFFYYGVILFNKLLPIYIWFFMRFFLTYEF